MLIYKQSTGELFRDGALIGRGYSGLGVGKNNPDLQNVHDVGPIPCGIYDVEGPFDSPDHGPYCLRLTPRPETNTFGRSGFLMHGDNKDHPGRASKGCIIQSRDVRESAYAASAPVEVIA